jgi:hypothetical protein
MNAFNHLLQDEFIEKSNLLNNQKGKRVSDSKEFILWSESKIDELHQLLKNHDFKDEKEEIEFFKEIKPRIFSKLFFQKERLRLITNVPFGKCLSLKFYEEELLKISQNQIADFKFYSYYKGLSNELDILYFTRKTKKCILETDSSCIGFDKRVSTCYDYKIATILANEELILYIENRIKKIKCKNKTKSRSEKKLIDIQTNLKWTGSKTELTELVYALHFANIVNNGNSEIKDIARVIGRSFNMDITDNLYRTFKDIKNRKTPNSNFTHSLNDIFQNKLIEDNN